MRPMTQWARWVGASLVVVVSLGCGDSNNTVYPVKGKITFEGKPMKGGGAISFMPVGNQAGKAPGGEIDENGNYVLTTYKPGDGSMAGEFRVVILQVVEKEPEPTPDGRAPAPAPPPLPVADRIPAIYADPQRTPLTTKVEAKGANELNFDLKRSAEPPPIRGASNDGPAKDRIASRKP
jgi:hypothetical protein